MKKLLCLLLTLILMLTLFACGKKSVTCDHCGNPIDLPANSNITEDWIVYCKTCELELFGEEGLVS